MFFSNCELTSYGKNCFSTHINSGSYDPCVYACPCMQGDGFVCRSKIRARWLIGHGDRDPLGRKTATLSVSLGPSISMSWMQRAPRWTQRRYLCMQIRHRTLMYSIVSVSVDRPFRVRQHCVLRPQGAALSLSLSLCTPSTKTATNPPPRLCPPV